MNLLADETVSSAAADPEERRPGCAGGCGYTDITALLPGNGQAK